MKKRVLIILLGLMLLMMAFAAGQAFADEPTVVDGGRCNDSIKWSYLSDGTLRIYGSGKMPDYYDEDDLPWCDYISDVTKVIIAKGVTSVGGYACYEMVNLTEAVIPEGVTSIGNEAFESAGLTYIKLPSSLMEIDGMAFAYSALETIDIPNGLQKIWNYAFNECALVDIKIPNTVTHIGKEVFKDCEYLKSVTISKNVTKLLEDTFEGCESLEKVTIYSNLKEIDNTAFDYCHNLKEVYYYGNIVQFNNIVYTDSGLGLGEDVFKSANLICSEKANIQDGLVTIPRGCYEYTGSEICPEVKLSFGKYVPVMDQDYTVSYANNMNIGTATITLTGIGNFEGQKQITFGIYESIHSLLDYDIKLNTYSMTYNGSPRTPKVTVYNDIDELVEGDDFTVRYSDNKNAGTAFVEVVGIGPYYDSLYDTFTINKAANSITTPKKTYTKTAKATSSQSFALKAKAKGGTLTYKSSKSSVKVSSTGKVTIKKKFTGKATITITAKGKNYKTATRKVTVKVVKAPATKIKLSKSLKGSPGFSYSLKPKLVYSCEKLTGLKWSSSNKKVATVTSSGKVSLKKKGTATITCKLKNGKKYTCKVTVKKNSYFNMSYSDAKFYDSGYGDINFRFLDAHFSGKTLIANFAIYNNRIFYATKFDWITYKVYYNDYNKAIKTYTMHNVPIKLGEYQKKKLTVKIPMKKVYDLAHAEDFWVEDYDYYYYYNY